MRVLYTTILSLLPFIVDAGKLTLQSPRVVVSDSGGSILRNEPLSKTRLPSPPLTVSSSDTLKFTVQILDGEDGKPVQPHQTFLRFYDSVNNEEGIQPLRVSSTGKASFELNMARPPASIPPTPNETVPLQVSLILGSSEHSPLSQSLFELFLPVSRPASKDPEERFYAPQPEIHHTFRAEPKTPYRIFSAVGTGLVLFPWVILIGLWSVIPNPLPHLTDPLILLFIGLLGSLEGLLFVYWVQLKLGDVLLYGAILGSITIAVGKSALRKVGERRLRKA